MVRIRVPATTANLGPGFDCLGMALSIYNYITLSQSESGRLQMTCSGRAATADIALDETNLVYRAMSRVFELAGTPAEGLVLHLELDAPLARGLGSSASAIVGGMFAANELLGNPLSTEQLLVEVTKMEGHPDNVVPCLVGGLTASIVLQDRVLYEKTAPAANVSCVVFVPDYELETSTSRGVMPKEVSINDAVFNSCRIPFVLASLQSGNLLNLSDFMDDRLHQPYRISLIAGYDVVRKAALDAGGAAVCISGAGPTILAVCDEAAADNVAAAGKAALVEAGVIADARIVKPDNEGCVREG